MPAAAFLKQRAVNLALSGSYTLANWLTPEGTHRTFACRTNRVSPFRMMVDVPVVGRIGDQVTSFFKDLGTLHGDIIDTVSGGFLLELRMGHDMRERLSNQLIWLEKRQKDAKIPEARGRVRILPANPHSVLTFADGSARTCFVIDVSASGAAVSSEIQLDIGTPVAVGTCIGRVVRHLPNGFAVQFVDTLNFADLDRRISRPVAPNSGARALSAHEFRRTAETSIRSLRTPTLRSRQDPD